MTRVPTVIGRRRGLLLLAAAGSAASVASPAAFAENVEEEDDPAVGRQPPRLRTPCPVRLRPGAAPVMLQAQTMNPGGSALLLRFTGEGTPAGEIRLASWYGYARPFAVLPLRGREVVLAAFEGNHGTGVYQEIQAVIGQDDVGGALRILALETLSYRVTGMCGEGAAMTGRFSPLADGSALRLDLFARGRGGDCPPRRGGPPRWREEWGTTLRWSGSGPLVTARPAPGAGPTRRRVEAARAKVHRWLAAVPRTAVGEDDKEALGLMEVLGRARSAAARPPARRGVPHAGGGR